ncbi:MAG: hypothetical protein NUW23_15295 [Firmicutes bacterium]|jgi:hypothetical protein|nr:hypothetical protein [Bacillota bacterium]
MRIGDVKGLLVVTLILDEKDVQELSSLPDHEVVNRARGVLTQVVPPNYIKDILVGHEGDTMHVAVSI